MGANSPVASILETLTHLHGDLISAQQGPMEPQLRKEFARITAATQRSLASLDAAHQSAATDLAAKQQRAAAMEEANKQRIAKQKKAIAQPAEPSPARPAIDPTLGQKLAAELLARQRPDTPDEPAADGAAGVLDDWDWRPTRRSRGSVAEA